MKKHALFGLALAASLSFPFAAFAEDAPTVSGADADALMKALREQSARLEEQEKKLVEHEKELDAQRRSLAQERIQFEKLQTQVISLTGKPLPMPAKSTAAKAAPTAETKQAAATPQEVGTERKEAKEKPPEVAAIIDEGGVLTGAGKLVVTPALEYTHSSNTAVEISGFSVVPALNIGLFDISQVNRDMITPSLGLRYGITNRLEVEAKVPYVLRKDSTLSRPVGVGGATNTLNGVSGNDIGDVEAAAHYQINKGQGGWPFFIGNLRLKSATGTSPFEVPIVNGVQQELPTGSGFYGVQPSVTAIYPTDPLVYYSNLGYLHSFSRSFPVYGDIQPGDAFSASLGMSISLNDKSSFSVGYSHTTALRTQQNGQPIANSQLLQVGALDFGYSYSLSDQTNLNFTASAGVTADAPDIRLIFRVPMTFDLR